MIHKTKTFVKAVADDGAVSIFEEFDRMTNELISKTRSSKIVSVEDLLFEKLRMTKDGHDQQIMIRRILYTVD